jgi:uncharacterized protein YhdP
MLSSQHADFDVNVSWNGYPDQISPLIFNGLIDLDIQKGLIQGVTVGQGPMAKLLGLANFNTLARRLRLDFKDLNPEGTAYDQMLGRMDFKEGQVFIHQPLIVSAPSSTFQAIGMADLKKQRVDAQYSLTLPLTGNLTLAAAAIGGLPAAVGFYVVGKLFKKQADQLSTFHGTINGPWSDPKVKLKKVSGSDADNPLSITQSEDRVK